MKAITLLTRSGGADLTLEEDAQFTRELANAYHLDEASATSRDIQRIAESFTLDSISLHVDTSRHENKDLQKRQFPRRQATKGAGTDLRASLHPP